MFVPLQTPAKRLTGIFDQSCDQNRKKKLKSRLNQKIYTTLNQCQKIIESLAIIGA